jgi:hypothetical protein
VLYFDDTKYGADPLRFHEALLPSWSHVRQGQRDIIKMQASNSMKVSFFGEEKQVTGR